MTRTTLSPSSFRRPLPSALASAIVGSLVLAAALPGPVRAADDLPGEYLLRRSMQAAFAQHAAGGPALPRHPRPVPAVERPVPLASGQPGDAESWRTDEFRLDWGLGAINADAAYARGVTGQGVRLGVFDTGTGLDHDEFAGKNHHAIHIGDLLPDGSRCTNTTALQGPDACFSSRGDDVAVDAVFYDDSVPQRIRDLIEAGNYAQPGASFENHGTHVSGTIAANRDGRGMHGVAFGADLTAARLFFNTARIWAHDPDTNTYVLASTGDVGPHSSALQEMYAKVNDDGVRAINHSWGRLQEPAPEYYDQIYSDPLQRAQLDLYAEGSRRRGMIQVWAAGNTEVPNPSPEAAPVSGIYATLPRGFPEIEHYWLSVVNVDRDLQLSTSSHRCGLAAAWCLAAPGTAIVSAVYGADSALDANMSVDADDNLLLEVNGRVPTYAYESLSGTSMAAPHVTGALGLLFERFPYLDNAQVRDVLLTTATDLGEPGVDDVYGWGLVNLRKAIEGYGSLRVDTDVVMNHRAGGLKVWDGDAWDDWTNDIGGPGALTKSGIGWLRLSGDNRFNGALVREGILELDGANALTAAVTVDGGQLRLNGRLVSTDLNVLSGSSIVSAGGRLDGSALAVRGGVVSFNGVQHGATTFVGVDGRLQGTGTLGATTVEGIIAPGNSIGTLTIDGNYVQTASGTFVTELAPGGRGDQLHVTGTAALAGTLAALPEPGIYYLGEQFSILRADGGVDGTFAQADFSAFSPFLAFGLRYAGNEVAIDVTRGQPLATAAVTGNQRAVAASADRLAVGQGLPRPLTVLFPSQVGAALDALSGELHAATPLALVESSRYVREAALGRAGGARSPQAEGDPATGAWVQAIGGSGRLDGSIDTARTRSTTSGLLVGIDRDLGRWQFGVLAGSGRTDTTQGQGRAAKARIDNTHVGLYAGHQWGGFGLRGGLGYGRHALDTRRQVAFSGFSNGLNARYDAKTTQAFIEAGYRFGGAQGGLTPYLQVARVDVQVDDVREQGGAAALSGTVGDTATTLATAGVRFDAGLKAAFQQDAWLRLVGGVGYRRATGDRNGQAALAFKGGDRFSVGGAPIAAGAVVAELGLSAWLTARQQLELGYNGEFGDTSRDHGLNARWSVRF